MVALKVLRQLDAAAIYRFKKEFRALSDFSHPNLVQLYELLSDGDRWFFTMELVQGEGFLEHVRPGSSQGHLASETPTVVRPESDSGSERRSTGGVCRLDRLRPTLVQLARGLDALHGTGKLHCDIKPSNVLVTPEGRVVLLDLGLVRDFLTHRLYESLDRDIVGTPAYMSPEQAAGLTVSAASDWYSVGVMLYEALCGELPFQGPVMKILIDKQKVDPPPPSSVAVGEDVPEDLDTLCQALLHRDPEQRPRGSEVRSWLGEPDQRAGQPKEDPAPRSSSSLALPFVGRQEQLDALRRAFDDTAQGRTVAVFVHGASGTGKTALLRRFLQDLHLDHEEVVVLAGRCYQREAVPYKALDSVIDALSRYLRSLPLHEAELLLPYNVLALARLFPVLKRVEAVAGARRRVLDIPDSHELRRRAFQALRELFLRLTDRSPVVLFIDDLHWGDLDSASLLNEILRPPDPPPLLLIACFRSDEAMTSPLLRTLFSSELTKAATEVRELRLRDLKEEEARELASRLLGSRFPGRDLLAATIAREARGNPFFVDALVRYAQTLSLGGENEHRLDQAVADATLDKALQARIEQLPREARTLLELIAVAGRPLDLEVGAEAAGIHDSIPAALAALRAVHLVRLRSGKAGEVLESYHDRIREVMLDLLDESTLRSHHGALARAMEASGRADPEALALHFQESGEVNRAIAFATQAADQAVEALAFDRGARLYRIALDLTPKGRPTAELMVKLGSALTNAGRGAEAAQALLTAAEDVPVAEAVELRRRAAEQLLISGRIDKGITTIRRVLATFDLSLPATAKGALVSLLRRRATLKLRGLGFKERSAAEIPDEELLRIDTCWAVSRGLGLVDILRGMDFGTLSLLLSLKWGEPYRIARALALETGYAATKGSRNLKRTAQLERSAMSLARQIDHPHALGLAHLTSGVASYLQGSWKKGLERLDQAEELLREHCTGVPWELDTAFIFQFRALLFMGRYGEVRKRLPGLLKEVQERGDLYAETNLRSRVSWVLWLIQDEPAMAAEEARQAIGRWSQEGFHLQHYWHLTGVAEIALYTGDPRGAWRTVGKMWEGFDSSLLLRIQFTRTEAYHLRARVALAAAVAATGNAPGATAEGKALLKECRKALKKIEKEKLLWADPLAQLVRAGIASAAGEKEKSARRLERAAAGLDAADMALYAAAARRRLGQLRGSREGASIVETADSWMQEQGIRRPAFLCDVLAPGRWPAPPAPKETSS